MKREVVPFAPDAAVEWPSNPVATDTRQRDAALAELVRLYDGGATPESAAKALLADHEEGPVYEAVDWAQTFSEHYFGAQNDEWTAAVLAAFREEEG